MRLLPLMAMPYVLHSERLPDKSVAARMNTEIPEIN